MDFKFSNESGDSQKQEAPGEKKNQSALLVLLLILVGGFTYLYFFTDLIKPQEVQKTAEVIAPVVPAVKIPLPPREGESVKPEEKAPEKTDVPKVAATPAAKTAPATSKPKEEPKKTAVPKPTDKKPQPVPVTDKKSGNVATIKSEEKKPVVEAKKLAVADKKGVPAKDSVKKPVSGGHAKPGSVVKAQKSVPGPWSIVVGSYVLEEALSADMGRVRKAGFEPIIKPSPRKTTTMSRLFVSEFNDRATAQPTLDKLNRYTSDAFVIEQGGKFAVYAGSYLQSEAARSEKERLKAAGFVTVVKHANIAIPSQRLSVGPFKNKKVADSALGRLKSAGIKATLSQQ